jgi:hypothetical protein
VCTGEITDVFKEIATYVIKEMALEEGVGMGMGQGGEEI